MDKRKVTFEHDSRQLGHGKFIGTATFIETDGVTKRVSVSYPEQFDSACEAAAHAYREAVFGRGSPFH